MTKEQYEKLKEWVRVYAKYQASNADYSQVAAIEKELDKLMGFEE